MYGFLQTALKKKVFLNYLSYTEAHLKRARGGGTHPPFFLQSVVFCNHFAELEIVLFELKLIINNAPLKYVYPNTKETCLSPNHLLFGGQLLYSSNTASTVAPNLTTLSSTTDEINYISNHFGDSWRHEYVVNLHQTQ